MAELMDAQASLYPLNTVEALREGTVYMRTTSLLRVSTPVVFDDGTRIRHYTAEQAAVLYESLRKRNVFARHWQDRDSYSQRATAFADQAVIEVVRNGSPDHVRAEVTLASDLAEQVTLLAASLVVPRRNMLGQLGIGGRPSETVELLRGPGLAVLRTKTSPIPAGGGVHVDGALAKRVKAVGLSHLYTACCGAGDLSKRLTTALGWLFESRCEPRLGAAIVKTAIALESLLIFTESESLARSLSERMAFLLSGDGPARRRIASAVKRFYDARSGVVHGSRKKRSLASPELLEGVDRLLVLALAVVATGAAQWAACADLSDWCETERWGSPQTIVRPFGKKYLRAALTLCDDGQ